MLELLPELHGHLRHHNQRCSPKLVSFVAIETDSNRRTIALTLARGVLCFAKDGQLQLWFDTSKWRSYRQSFGLSDEIPKEGQMKPFSRQSEVLITLVIPLTASLCPRFAFTEPRYSDRELVLLNIVESASTST